MNFDKWKALGTHSLIFLGVMAVLACMGLAGLFLSTEQQIMSGAFASFMFNITTSVVKLYVIIMFLKWIDGRMSETWRNMINGWGQYAAIYYCGRFIGAAILLS